ncbi:DUF4065 domain-containing protein [Acetobacteraceae bacterium]|nr:DUF4065 domain-containing protein [Acetobacteraceae bacterium]
MLSAQTVANRLIELARKEGKAFTPLQLQKLVYLAHAWTLGLDHKPLITNRIEAWQYGPVIPDMYDQLRRYKAEPVKQLIPAMSEHIKPRQEDIIKEIYKTYGDLTGGQLVSLTHKKGTPWSEVFNNGAGQWDIIPDDLIQRHYEEKLAKNNQ